MEIHSIIVFFSICPSGRRGGAGGRQLLRLEYAAWGAFSIKSAFIMEELTTVELETSLWPFGYSRFLITLTPFSYVYEF